MFLCLLVESGRAVLLPHAYTVSDEPRSMVNVTTAHLGLTNLATHGVRCYPKQTVRSVQDGNAESDSLLRFTLVRAGKCCRLSARIPNHVSENRIHAPLNAGNFTSESGMVLTEFVEKNLSVLYRAYIEELRESTKKGCRETWNNHIRESCRAYLHA